VSGVEHSMGKLFARAAALLRGEELDAARDHDAENLLQALEYVAVEPAHGGNAVGAETANQAICSWRLPDSRVCSNWPRPTHPG